MTPSTAPPAEALDLVEGLASAPSDIGSDGLVKIHIIRPTVGKGKGNHKYTPEMLQENADVFTGWKMYIDHQSTAAKKASEGLPRSIRDLGGRIVESRWDPDVPAEGRYGQGAIVGMVRPVGAVKKLIEEDPGLLEASIRAKATDVHPEMDNGEQVWVVEGIRRDPPGSVDWVSEGGAGGRVADLIEGLITEANAPDEETAEGGDEVSDLLEALRDPESDASKAIGELVETKVSAQVDEIKEQHQRELEEAKTEAHAEGKAEGQAEGERKAQLQDLKSAAHTQIEEASWLPEVARKRLRDEFDLVEGHPTPKLDVEDSVDDEGAVTKTAAKQLEEAVASAIEEQRELIAAIDPTRVTGQGASTPSETTPAPAADSRREGGYHKEFLQESGVDADEAWPELAEPRNDDPKE